MTAMARMRSWSNSLLFAEGVTGLSGSAISQFADTVITLYSVRRVCHCGGAEVLQSISAVKNMTGSRFFLYQRALDSVVKGRRIWCVWRIIGSGWTSSNGN
jgi:hypothetical protein